MIPEMQRVPAGFSLAALVMFLLPATRRPWGVFIDELYYLSCSARLDWGYVDHPPLAPFILRLSRLLFGDGLLALRLPAALAAAVLVYLTGSFAARLGAGRAGQAIACAALLASPVLEIVFGFFSMNAFEVLLWAAALRLLAEILLGGPARLWLVLGVVLGVGLENKHTIVLLGAGAVLGVAVTAARRELLRPGPWLAAGIAALLALPNLLWQAAHGWPSLEFYRNADRLKNVVTPPLDALLLQALAIGPGGLPVAIAGLVLLWRRKQLRPLAVCAVALLVFMVVSGKSRPDRSAGLIPLLCSAGGVALADWLRRPAARAAVLAWIAAGAALFLPLPLLLFSPPMAASYAQKIGAAQQTEAGEGKRAELPQWLADKLAWQQLADDVAAVRDRLPPEDRARVSYFAPSYGQASALEWLGHLHPVYSTHNSWYLWGPPPHPIAIAIVVDGDRRELSQLFEEVELAATHDCDYCMPWRDDIPIFVVRRARVPLATKWEGWKKFE